MTVKMAAGVVPPVLKFIDDIAQMRPSRLSDPVWWIDASPCGVIETVLVMGIRVTLVCVRVVVPKDRAILLTLYAGVISVFDGLHHDPTVPVLDRQCLFDIDEETMETSDPAADD